jgi:hypothetical protein
MWCQSSRHWWGSNPTNMEHVLSQTSITKIPHQHRGACCHHCHHTITMLMLSCTPLASANMSPTQDAMDTPRQRRPYLTTLTDSRMTATTPSLRSQKISNHCHPHRRRVVPTVGLKRQQGKEGAERWVGGGGGWDVALGHMGAVRKIRPWKLSWVWHIYAALTYLHICVVPYN